MLFDLKKVVPSYIDFEEYTTLNDGIKNKFDDAVAVNFLLIVANISNALERIAATQEAMNKNGEKAMAASDAALSAALGMITGAPKGPLS